MTGERPGQGPGEQHASAPALQSAGGECALTAGSPAPITSADTRGADAPGHGSGPAAGHAASAGHVLAAGEYFSVTRRADPLYLTLAGEFDICSLPDLTAALADAAGSAGTLHLDLADVRYCDLAALRAILGPVQARDDQQHLARPVVLHHPPAQVLRILQLTGWNALPGLTIDSSQTPPRTRQCATAPETADHRPLAEKRW